MKLAEANPRFPALGFTRDSELLGFPDLNILTSCGPWTLERGLAVGMELVDADLRRWRVEEVRRLGRAQPFIPWLFGALLTAKPQSRIDYELEQLEPITLGEVKARISEWMKANPPEWAPDDDLDKVIATDFADLKAAKSIKAIYQRFPPDTFEGQ